MNRIRRRTMVAGSVALSIAAPAIVRAERKYDPGATDQEIRIGHTNPYSGPASSFGIIGKGHAAYWNWVNDTGGINGRKVKFISYDDGMTPPKAVEMVRKLVEEDQVLAIFQLLGTASNAVVRKYLNQKKVPQLFTGSGSSQFGDPEHFPWTMGWQPTYADEAEIYAKHILANYKGAKIGVFFQNDDAGRDYLMGFRKGLGPEGEKLLVATAGYEIMDPTVDSQVAQLKASGATVFFIQGIDKQCAQAIRKAADLGWTPVRYLSNPSASIASTLKPAGLDISKGVITSLYIKDPTDGQWASLPDFVAWEAWMAKYLPQASKSDYLYAYSYAVSATLRHCLTLCGDTLTRENLMNQATSMKNVEIPLLLPGIKLNTSAKDYFPIQSLRLAQFDGESWRLFGDILSSDSN
jgi:branched-chain amino acid transport system substrate-binding protein